MQLQPSQYAALKAAIAADPILSAYPNTQDGAYMMCQDRLNVAFSPTFYVWQDQLTPDIYDSGLIAGATQIDALTQGKRDELFMIGQRTRNCNDVNVRAAIADAVGSQNTLKAAMQAIQYRPALYVEKIYATGTGTTASPATLVFAGQVNYQDVYAARNS